jgi:hypothetical protein
VLAFCTPNVRCVILFHIRVYVTRVTNDVSVLYTVCYCYRRLFVCLFRRVGCSGDECVLCIIHDSGYLSACNVVLNRLKNSVCILVNFKQFFKIVLHIRWNVRDMC